VNIVIAFIASILYVFVVMWQGNLLVRSYYEKKPSFFALAYLLSFISFWILIGVSVYVS